MCAGCGVPDGAPLICKTTWVLLPCGVIVAVPVSPELFCWLSFTVTGLPCARAAQPGARSIAAAVAEARMRSMLPPKSECRRLHKRQPTFLVALDGWNLYI